MDLKGKNIYNGELKPRVLRMGLLRIADELREIEDKGSKISTDWEAKP